MTLVFKENYDMKEAVASFMRKNQRANPGVAVPGLTRRIQPTDLEGFNREQELCADCPCCFDRYHIRFFQASKHCGHLVC